MNRLGIARIVLSLVLALQGSVTMAQTVISRLVIDDNKGDDAHPRIAALGNGKYAVVWARHVGEYESSLYARVVDINGHALSPVRKNILATTIANPWSYDVAGQGTGSFLIAGQRNSDSAIVSRRFKSDAKPLAALTVVTPLCNDPRLAMGPTGTALGCVWGSQSYAGILDANGRLIGSLLQLQPSSTSRYFGGEVLIATPTGFLYLGRETPTDYSQRRAAGCLIQSDVSSATKAIAYQGFQPNVDNTYLDGAFDDMSGFVLFGSGVVGSGGVSYYRRLKSDGKPAAAAKRFPAGNATYAHVMQIRPLTGTGRFVCAWLDERDWNEYMQIRKADGSDAAPPVAVSSNYLAMSAETVDMVYDPTTERILAAWIERATAQNPTTVWIGVFDVSSIVGN